MLYHQMKIVAFAVFGLALATNAYGGPGQRYHVRMDGTKVYQAPSTTAPVIMQLNKGDRVLEWRRQGQWVKVSRFGAVGKDGWVRISRLRTEAREIEIGANRNGQFFVEATVNGKAVRFLVDTGATHVALRPEDAGRLGFAKDKLEFSMSLRTAGGVVRAAPVVLDEIRIGPLIVRGVIGVVNKRSMSHSLLGMSFLRRLRGYEVRGKRLIIRW